MSTDLSYEELKKLLDNTPEKDEEQKEAHKNRSVLSFIRDRNVTSGEHKIPTYVIYCQYRDWNYSNLLKVRPSAFFRTFKQYFEQKRSGNQRFYMLNDSLIVDQEKQDKYKRRYYYFAKNYAKHNRKNGRKK